MQLLSLQPTWDRHAHPFDFYGVLEPPQGRTTSILPIAKYFIARVDVGLL